MCGIAAAISSKDGHIPNEHDVTTMISVLEHRGPDDMAYASFAGGQVLLAHARLAIVDLDAGPQPLIRRFDGFEYAISYNGEIYDLDILRSRLSMTFGVIFRTRTDTEVVLALYVQYGLQCFEHLNGEWAFVIWDGKLQRTIAGRDRFGIKPLFYHRTKDITYYASEWNLRCLFSHSVKYADIKMIEPGQYRVTHSSGLEFSQYHWRPKFDVAPQMTLEEASTGLRERLKTAVHRRLECDVPICAYLSDGTDSTVVTSIASSVGKLQTYNISFSNSEYDERREAEEIANFYNVPLKSLACSTEILAAHVEEALHHTEMSCPNAGFVGKYLLSNEIRKDGYRVALTGEGSDEILAGYPFFKLEKLWRMKLAQENKSETLLSDPSELFERFRIMERRSEGLLWNDNENWRKMKPVLGFYSASYLRALTFGKIKRLLLCRQSAGTSHNESEPTQIFETGEWDFLCGLDPLQISMVMNYRHLTNWIFPCLGDRLEMAHGVEGRTSFLDNDVVDFVATIPPDMLLDMANLREKRVLYKAYEGKLPYHVERSHKHPFFAPSWRSLYATETGRALFKKHTSFIVLKEASVFSPLVVTILSWLWKLVPADTVLFRKLDAAMGVVLSVQILHKLFILPEHTASDSLYHVRRIN